MKSPRHTHYIYDDNEIKFKLEQATIAAEAARPPAPPRATPSATGHPHRSQAAAVIPAGTGTRQISPPCSTRPQIKQRMEASVSVYGNLFQLKIQEN